jgi:hypothetical protein
MKEYFEKFAKIGGSVNCKKCLMEIYPTRNCQCNVIEKLGETLEKQHITSGSTSDAIPSQDDKSGVHRKGS